MDPRSVVALANLKDALIELCKQLPFAEISVAALCREASVSRKTFYGHYSDLPAVATAIVRELGIELAQAIKDEHLRVPHSASGIFQHVVAELTTRRDVILVVCRRFPVDAVRRGCLPVIAMLFDRAEQLNNLDAVDPIAKQFWCETIASSIATMFSVWASRGFKDDPRVFAEIGVKYLAPGIDIYWSELRRTSAR